MPKNSICVLATRTFLLGTFLGCCVAHWSCLSYRNCLADTVPPSSPQTPDVFDVNSVTRSASRLIANGQIDQALRILSESRQSLIRALGPQCIDATQGARVAEQFAALKSLSPDRQRLFCDAYGQYLNGEEGVRAARTQEICSPDDYLATARLLLSARHAMKHAIGQESLFTSECDQWLGIHYTTAREFSRADLLFQRARARLVSLFGEDSLLVIDLDCRRARAQMEQGNNLAGQKIVLERAVAFAQLHMPPQRYPFYKESCLVQLAEACFRNGDIVVADRIFGQVQQQLPETSSYALASHCRIACMTHRARTLIAVGESEEALATINSLIADWYEQPRSEQSLRMERLFRMRAEVYRKLGRERDAESDERTVKRITDNVARLHAAIAELPDPAGAEGAAAPTTQPPQ